MATFAAQDESFVPGQTPQRGQSNQNGPGGSADVTGILEAESGGSNLNASAEAGDTEHLLIQGEGEYEDLTAETEADHSDSPGIEESAHTAPMESDDFNLTAKEMRQAVVQFADILDEDDQCCIILVLSHGMEGYIYGYDGFKVSIESLISLLNNANCSAMMEKPRIVILQACSGSHRDKGVPAGPGHGAVPAATGLLPTMSDFIVCSAAVTGQASYSYTEKSGSVFISKMLEVFQKHACDTEILQLMTKVNRLVAKDKIQVELENQHPEECMQMSHCDFCLRYPLYLFPCEHDLGMNYEDHQDNGDNTANPNASTNGDERSVRPNNSGQQGR